MHSSDHRKTERSIVLLPICLILVVIAVLNLFGGDKAYSETEKRPLAARPKIEASALRDGRFFADADAWYADQFLGRDFWIRLHDTGNRLFGLRESSDVLAGKNGRLFGKLVAPDPGATEKTVEALGRFAGNHADLPMHLFLVPNAAAIQTDELPHGAPIRDQAADIRGFLATLPDSIDAPDLTALLLEHADAELYYRTDHHWTTDCAFHIFRETAPLFGIEDTASYTRYLATDRFFGTLSAKTGRRTGADDIWIYASDAMPEVVVNIPDTLQKSTSFYQNEALDGDDPYTVFLGGNHPLVEISTTVMNGKHLLIFKDSYANSFVPFLAPYYETITMVDPRYYYDDTERLLKQKEITEVLFLYSADTLFEDTSLAPVLG